MFVPHATLAGLGAVIPPTELYRLATQVGFPPDTAVKMTAIALKESGGNPNAHYAGKTGTEEDSYGLYQINMKGALGDRRMQQFGLATKSQLYDPLTNTRAAFQTWGGNDRNLDVAWYIDSNAYERGRFQSFMPQAVAAAASAGYTQPGGTGGTGGTGDGGDAGSEGQLVAGLDNGMLFAIVSAVALAGAWALS